MNRIGKYEIHQEIGSGGFGTVYKGRDTVLNVDRAIKVLHPALIVDPHFIERFRQEAQLAARLEHPALIPVYDFGEESGRFYLVMKYMEGGSLKSLLEEHGKLSDEKALIFHCRVGVPISGSDFTPTCGDVYQLLGVNIATIGRSATMMDGVDFYNDLARQYPMGFFWLVSRRRPASVV